MDLPIWKNYSSRTQGRPARTHSIRLPDEVWEALAYAASKLERFRRPGERKPGPSEAARNLLTAWAQRNPVPKSKRKALAEE